MWGADATTDSNAIGVITEVEWAEVVNDWLFPEPTPGTPGRTPTIIEKGQARLVGNAARICAGAVVSRAVSDKHRELNEELKQAQVALAKAQTDQLSKASGMKVKLNEILNQGLPDSCEGPMLSQWCVDTCNARYEVLFGRGKRPPEPVRPTPTQLSALKAGAHHGRHLRRICHVGPK